MPKKQRVPVSVKDALKEQAVKGKVRPPDLAKLVSHYFDVAGGERQVARQLYEEYCASHPGGVVRQRILDLILRMTKAANEKSGPVEDTSQLSNEDLERELDQLLEAVADEASEHGDLGQQDRESSGAEEGQAPDAPSPAPGDPAGADPGAAPAPAGEDPQRLGPGGPRGDQVEELARGESPSEDRRPEPVPAPGGPELLPRQPGQDQAAAGL